MRNSVEEVFDLILFERFLGRGGRGEERGERRKRGERGEKGERGERREERYASPEFGLRGEIIS